MTMNMLPKTANCLPLCIPLEASFPLRPPTMKTTPMMMERIPRMAGILPLGDHKNIKRDHYLTAISVA
jgi:hypothetical protein